MDMLDQALDTSSPDKTNDSITSDENSHIHSDDGVEEHATAVSNIVPQTATILDSGVQYQLRTENGPGGAVTYRVVQLAHAQDVTAEAGTHVVTTGTTLVGQQVTQAIIASPFTSANGSGSPTSDGQPTDTRFAYLPATSSVDDAAAQGDATLSSGQFYVMMSPQEVLQPGHRTLAPRTHQFCQKTEGGRTTRDERRRATHNEVERRRRDKINAWIGKLAKIVPDCTSDNSKQGQVRQEEMSKGGILAKACDYIQDLRASSCKLPEVLKEKERLTMDLELLRQQCEDLMNENQLLRAHLQQNGIIVTNVVTNSR